jgi:hypothetical protein
MDGMREGSQCGPPEIRCTEARSQGAQASCRVVASCVRDGLVLILLFIAAGIVEYETPVCPGMCRILDAVCRYQRYGAAGGESMLEAGCRICR